MNWLCCQAEQIRKIYPQYNYNWYTKHEQSTSPSTSHNYDERLIRCDRTKTPYEFENYARVKIKSKDVHDIVEGLSKASMHFVDQDFMHVGYHVGRGGGVEGVEWSRVADVVDGAVYSLPNQQPNLSNFKTNNTALQTCVTLISRTHPRKLHRIRSQILNRQGIYQFKLFKNGIIYNMIIDDYVPTFKGYHVFTGPANHVEVYPMLLEKAIAKICGGYSQMPKNALFIMEMIYCGAIRRQNLDNLKNIAQFNEVVVKSLAKQGLTLLIAKSDKKIRQYGINHGQIYHIINHHNIQIHGESPSDAPQSVTLYQMSQTRLSAWNGCFHITDPQWKSVPHAQYNRIMKSMQSNQSFVVADREISRVFQMLIAYEDTETSNKDWQENFSSTGHPSFCSFHLKNYDTVFLRVTTKCPVKQSFILCKAVANAYQFIGGCFDDNVEYLQSHFQLEPGNYLICVFQDWQVKKQGVSYTCHRPTNTATIPKFLDSLFIEHSTRMNKSMSTIFYQCLREIGLGYLRVMVKPSQIKKISVNHKKIEEQGWQILQPHNGLKQIITTSPTLIILRLVTIYPKQLTNFPIEAFIIN